MTRHTGAGSAFRVLGAFALVLAACGGGGTGDDDQAATTAAVASPETTVQAPEPTTTTEATQDTGDAEEDSTAQPTTSGRGSGSITVGGETYLFAVVDDEGSCDPDLFGVGFSAVLTRVDQDGNPIEMQDRPGSTEGVTVALPFEADTGGVIGGNFAGTAWSAGLDEESSIDSASIDGPRAEGTATFVTGDGEVVQGTFEVTCGRDSVQSSGSSGDFCDDLAASLVMDGQLDFADPDIDRLLAQAIDEFDGLRSRAPSEIAEDVDTLYEGVVLLEDIFSVHGYDVDAIPDDEMDRVYDESFTGAAQRLVEHCGF